MKKSSIKRITAIIAVLVLSFCMALSSYAANASGTITINLKDKTTAQPLKDVAFKLYYVAEPTGNEGSAQYKYTSDFEKCAIKLDRNDAQVPVHLKYYADEHKISYEHKITDANGKAVFTNLKEGIYLVTSSNMTVVPFLFSIPENIDGKNEYNVVAEPKTQIENEDSGKIDLQVEKVWKATSHPGSITAVLLKDGKEYSQAVLSSDNNWKTVWENLDASFSWQVVEKDVPEGFYVSYEVYNDKFVIVNTQNETTQDETEESSDVGSEDLENTGELNWPVPVMAISGILIFSIGWVMLNIKKKSV